jgi:hypothetical protein
MYRIPDPDVNFAMAAQAFEGIINQVVASNLNFCLEQSPFSAVIHLKKSVIRNKSGTLLIPPPPLSVQLLQAQSDNYRQAQKIIKLESIINSFKSDSVNSANTILELEGQLEREKFQANSSLDLEKEALQTAQNRFDTENELLDYKVKELEAKVKDLTDVGAKEINEENKVLKRTLDLRQLFNEFNTKKIQNYIIR